MRQPDGVSLTMYSRGHSMVLEDFNIIKREIALNLLQISSPEPRDSQESSVSRESRAIDVRGQPRCTNVAYYEILGFRGSAISTTGSRYSTYSLALRFSTPSIAFLGTRMFSAHLAFRRFELAGPSLFPLPQSGLSLHNLVAEDSPIMSACEKGDLRAVQLLFQTRQARPDDITADNMTTMKVR
jgi:hypothetical protein